MLTTYKNVENSKKITKDSLQKGKILPKITSGGNIKLGNKSSIGVWSTLKGNEYFYVNSLGGYAKGTCGDHCECCTNLCYVNSSYRYGSVIYRHGINSAWMLGSVKETFKELDKQLSRKKKQYEIIRINQSGELTSKEELKEWVNLATKYDKTLFYVYTKNYETVQEMLKDKVNVPKNFTILISIWHENGIKEYKKLQKYDFIKAFVYDDGEVSIKPQTWCAAYNEKGKLNHDITCEKCKKCFNRSEGCKIIGCKSH